MWGSTDKDSLRCLRHKTKRKQRFAVSFCCLAMPHLMCQVSRDICRGGVGGGVEPPQRTLEGTPPKESPTTGETDKEGWIGIYEQREHVCLVRTPMAYSASTATACSCGQLKSTKCLKIGFGSWFETDAVPPTSNCTPRAFRLLRLVTQLSLTYISLDGLLSWYFTSRALDRLLILDEWSTAYYTDSDAEVRSWTSWTELKVQFKVQSFCWTGT